MVGRSRWHRVMARVGLVAMVALAGCDDGSTTPAATVDAHVDHDQGPSPDAAPDVAADAAVDGAADAAPAVDAAPPPLVPDELPTEGASDLAGVDDLTLPAPVGFARAGRADDAAELITGVEANCRVGDFRLDNAVVAVCIQAERSYGQFTFAGGDIIDAIRIDPDADADDWLDGDYFREAIHTVSLGEVSVERIGIVRDGSDGGPAIIRTEGTAGGTLIIQGVIANAFVPPPVPVVTEFRLAPDSDTVEVLTWISGPPDERVRIRAVDLLYFGDQTRDFPEGLSLQDTPQFIGAEGQGVSYGWGRPDGVLGLFPLVGLDLPVVAAQSDEIRLRAVDTALFRRQLRIGTGDVESLRTASPEAVPLSITGPPGLRLDIHGPQETRALLDADGARTVRVVPGSYTLTAYGWPGGDAEMQVELGAEGGEVAFVAPEPARLHITVTDTEDRPLIARVDLAGLAGRRLLVRDERTVELPAGAWTVTTTKGWHYAADERAVAVLAGETVEVEVVLEQLIPLDGWASGEFHQHASPSLDSEVPVLDRVLANIAEDVQFMVPSDHDVIYDYRGLVERSGLSDRVAVPLPGVEISPTFTHIGAYGLRYDPYAGAGGAPPLPVFEDGRWRIRTVPELVAEARARGARIVQMNHAHEDSGLFTHTGFTAETPIADLPADRFTADFDSLEISNRSEDTCNLLAEWMGLLNQGLRVTGIGNSDSHSLGATVGYPRNYLPTLADDPRRVTDDEVVAGVIGGQVFVGGGAVMDFPDGRLPGDEIELADDTLMLRVRVRTPSYAAIQRILAFVNGQMVVETPVESAAEDIVDFDGVIEIPVERDAHVELVALGDDSLAYIRPGRPVFAISNPLWIDRDGGGVDPVGPIPVTRLDLPVCN